MRYLGFLVAALLVLAACEEVGLGIGEEGSGNLVTEQRDVAEFNSIDVGSALDLDVTVDPAAAQSVVVIFDDNLIDKVVTRVSGETLILEIDGSVNLTGSADRGINVTMKELVSLEASGASDVTASGTTNGFVGLEASGASDVEVSGVTTSYRLDASGASSVDARDLVATDIDVDVSGASSVDLHSTGTVTGEVSGASSLDVYGDPISVLVDSSGASSIDIAD
jgi:hypothetical protein